MARDMARRCSHCGQYGHNSRTCPDRGVKLFGVRLTTGEMIMRKSVSMGNLVHYRALSSINPSAANEQAECVRVSDDGYLSDGLVHSSSKARDRKKGVPWSEEEHRMFLMGLEKLGKGDWRGISKNFVTTRTPTQVASHAQKYFLRQSSLNKRKRRSSLFDMSSDAVSTEDSLEKFYGFSPGIHQLGLASASSLVDGNYLSANLGLSLHFESYALPTMQQPVSALSLWPELAPHPSSASAVVQPNVADVSVDNCELDLSIAPPSADGPPLKLDQSSASFYLSSNGSAIRVV